MRVKVVGYNHACCEACRDLREAAIIRARDSATGWGAASSFYALRSHGVIAKREDAK